MSKEMFAAGLSALQHRNLTEAELCFSKAIQENPENPNYRYYRASVLRELGKSDEAESDLTSALESAPESYPIRYARGELYLEIGEMEKAEADFSRIIECEADGYWKALAFLGRGVIFLEAGDVESAIIDLSDAEDLAVKDGDKGLLARISSELERSGF